MSERTAEGGAPQPQRAVPEHGGAADGAGANGPAPAAARGGGGAALAEAGWRASSPDESLFAYPARDELSGHKRSRGSPSVARRATVAWGASAARLSRQISIDRLPEEGKRIDGYGLAHPALRREPSIDGPLNHILRTLLRPVDWTPPASGRFPFALSTIKWLCTEAQKAFAAEGTVVDLRAPVKVFGDIHGQFADLMRLFREYGAPSRDSDAGGGGACGGGLLGGGANGGGFSGGAARSPMGGAGAGGACGDLLFTDYLFLGDYVDRGSHSLEVVVLLLALKLAHPTRICLLRGNHELPEVNARDGFLLECCTRLGSREAGIEAWQAFNALFEWLPLCATINGVILCVHGGVGATLNHLSEIRRLQRPLRMQPDAPYAALLLDVLWSDPTEHDSIEGVHPNAERGDPVVRYGPDRVRSFLRLNGFKLIVRAHECVMDGFQRFAGGALLTIFSATNYCGVCANAGALLIVGKELECVPKLIYPCADLEDAWLRAEDMRPATPPRRLRDDDGGPGAHDPMPPPPPPPPPPLHAAPAPAPDAPPSVDARALAGAAGAGADAAADADDERADMSSSPSRPRQRAQPPALRTRLSPKAHAALPAPLPLRADTPAQRNGGHGGEGGGGAGEDYGVAGAAAPSPLLLPGGCGGGGGGGGGGLLGGARLPPRAPSPPGAAAAATAAAAAAAAQVLMPPPVGRTPSADARERAAAAADAGGSERASSPSLFAPRPITVRSVVGVGVGCGDGGGGANGSAGSGRACGGGALGLNGCEAACAQALRTPRPPTPPREARQ
ncbi:hypothetical protein KFE25_002367 [Diacronema lutheri]|uniref:Serine/threonine-protein phosphatase n=1 Tax=Diacronema lutheri TaxID=2081491 RepID=A0A8J5X7N0_DIALT|nr:hypothetical protein KFE25_002367 [Diacronema lutheri]